MIAVWGIKDPDGKLLTKYISDSRYYCVNNFVKDRSSSNRSYAKEWAALVREGYESVPLGVYTELRTGSIEVQQPYIPRPVVEPKRPITQRDGDQ